MGRTTTPPSLREKLHAVVTLAVLCSAQFFSLVGTTQTIAPMLVLSEFFAVSGYGEMNWFSTAYTLAVGVFMLPVGRLIEITSSKTIFLAGLCWLATWTLVAGFTHPSQHIYFTICRALQGMGPALMLPSAITLIETSFPTASHRNLAFAGFSTAGPLGTAASAVMSAVLSEKFRWQWCFWGLAIVCFGLGIVAWWALPTSPIERKDDEKKEFDFPGAVTGVLGLVMVSFTLNQAPLEQAGWNTPYIPTLLVSGMGILGVFTWIELRVAKHPILPLCDLYPHAALILFCVFAGWSSSGIWVYYLFIFLEQIRGQTATLSAAQIGPLAISGICFALLTVWLLSRYRIAVSTVMLVFAMGLFVIANMLMALTPPDQTYWTQTFVSVVLMSGAMTLSFPAGVNLLSETQQGEHEKQHEYMKGMAASSCLVAIVVNYGITCGLGLAGSIHKEGMRLAAKDKGITGVMPPLWESESSELATCTEVRLAGVRAAYWLAAALGGLGFLVAIILFLSQKKDLADDEKRVSSLVKPARAVYFGIQGVRDERRLY